MAKLIALLVFLVAALPAAGQTNKVVRLQTTDMKPISCNFPSGIATVDSVTFTLRYGADPDCPSGIGTVCGGAMVEDVPAISAGVYHGRAVPDGRVSVLIHPDKDTQNRNGNGYEVAVVATDGAGQRHTCRGPLRIENQEAQP